MKRCLVALAQAALCGALLGLTLLVGLYLYRPRTAGAQAEVPVNSEKYTSVTAQRLTVVDAAGQVRGEMAISDDGTTGIHLYDANKIARLSIDMGADGPPLISMSDTEGRARMLFACDEKGAPAIILLDNKERIRLQACLGPTGNPSLFLNDSAEKPRIGLAFNANNAPHVVTFDAKQNITATLKPVKGK